MSVATEPPVESFVHDGQRYTAAGVEERSAVRWTSRCKKCGEQFDFVSWRSGIERPASPNRHCKPCVKKKEAAAAEKKKQQQRVATERAVQEALDAQRPVSSGEWTRADQERFERLGARRRKAKPGPARTAANRH